MKSMRAALGVAALVCGAAPCVAADGLQGSAALTTDYVHRGISQSDGGPAVQGSLTWWHPTGFYVGAWASSVDTANPYVYPQAAGSHGAQVELDLYAGYGKPVGTDWALDLKAIGYLYPDDPAPVNYNYLEFSAGAVWRQRWYATVAVAPRTSWIARAGRGRDWTSVDAELAWQQPLSGWVSVMAGAGYRELIAPGRSGYLYGSLSLALQLRRASLEFGWFTTDSTARWLFGDRIAGSRAALTATVSF
jgi:uncharacterized protein (TIGR02001 family)